jgi:putative ABC transport system permease protein
VVATNRQGSVNGKTFVVGGILESATGPGGRDGYMHMEDAVELLRLTEKEVTEFVLNLKNGNNIKQVSRRLQEAFAGELNPMGMSKFEVHTWEQLSPFANIANMIDVMTFFIKLMLVAVVLVSILNVMIMAVYERIREIGTIAAIGTLPRKILSLFLVEGFFLGVTGAVLGGVVGGLIILALNIWKISFSFGRNPVVLSPVVTAWDVATVALAVIIVSVLASLQPAYKAAHMEPIDALRHV